MGYEIWPRKAGKSRRRYERLVHLSHLSGARSGRIGSIEGERIRVTRTEMHVFLFPVVTSGHGRRQAGMRVPGLRGLLLASQGRN